MEEGWTDEGWTRAVIALGANEGDREQTLIQAVADLRATEGVVVETVSDPVETVALTEKGYDPDAPRYLNQVVLVVSAWPAEGLLTQLQAIERRHGRERDGTRYAPRTLDLDLISYGDLVLDTESLILPHPRAHRRRFVLAPWLQVDPAATVPGRGSVADLLAALPEDTP